MIRIHLINGTVLETESITYGQAVERLETAAGFDVVARPVRANGIEPMRTAIPVDKILMVEEWS